MAASELSIGELADAAGLSRRAVRFYVQQGLLPPPSGRGRGSFYDESHNERLKKILELQQAGHSLDAIRRILDGKPVAAPASPPRRAARVNLSAELWTRLKLMEGVELHFDAARHNPEVEKLLALRGRAGHLCRIQRRAI
jgi:DNA-binding transcriptional MerR regulator